MRQFNGVLFPIEKPRVTMPFRAFETKWYSPEKPHRGVDVAPYPGSTGAPVRMPLTGRVVLADFHEFAGNQIITEHVAPYSFGAHGLDGNVYTVLADDRFWIRTTHHSDIMVLQGADVDAGALIAHIGSTGAFTTGPHVHMELHQGEIWGRRLDPIDFFIAAIPGLRDAISWPW